MFPRGLTTIARLAPLALALLAGCTTPPAEQGPVEAVAPVTPKAAPTGIQPGETLDVFVMEDDSFSGSYKVRSTGHIIVPKLGRVKVGGMSASEAERVLTSALQDDKLTKATVLVDRPDLNRGAGQPDPLGGTEVFLSGKVNRPGRYSVTGIGNAPPTVHQTILQAGGCSRFAHKAKVYVLRRGGDGMLHRINADLLAIENGTAKDVPVVPGDIIVVPEKVVDLGL